MHHRGLKYQLKTKQDEINKKRNDLLSQNVSCSNAACKEKFKKSEEMLKEKHTEQRNYWGEIERLARLNHQMHLRFIEFEPESRC
jgi:hypothetical protein